MSILSRIKSSIGKTYRALGGVIDRLQKGNVIEVKRDEFRKELYPDNDIEEIGATTYGEASSIEEPMLEKEMRAMVSSFLNRQDKINQVLEKRGEKPYSLSQVIEIPKQYLAYGSRQYEAFKNRDTREYGSEKKMRLLDAILQELKDGTFNRDPWTSFDQAPGEGKVKIGSHYFFVEDQFRTR